jgi:hypothetical protein
MIIAPDALIPLPLGQLRHVRRGGVRGLQLRVGIEPSKVVDQLGVISGLLGEPRDDGASLAEFFESTRGVVLYREDRSKTVLPLRIAGSRGFVGSRQRSAGRVGDAAGRAGRPGGCRACSWLGFGLRVIGDGL